MTARTSVLFEPPGRPTSTAPTASTRSLNAVCEPEETRRGGARPGARAARRPRARCARAAGSSARATSARAPASSRQALGHLARPQRLDLQAGPMRDRRRASDRREVPRSSSARASASPRRSSCRGASAPPASRHVSRPWPPALPAHRGGSALRPERVPLGAAGARRSAAARAPPGPPRVLRWASGRPGAARARRGGASSSPRRRLLRGSGRCAFRAWPPSFGAVAPVDSGRRVPRVDGRRAGRRVGPGRPRSSLASPLGRRDVEMASAAFMNVCQIAAG